MISSPRSGFVLFRFRLLGYTLEVFDQHGAALGERPITCKQNSTPPVLSYVLDLPFTSAVQNTLPHGYTLHRGDTFTG
jgi:hypothetical protein